jgi:uncharacterized membrane protein
MIIIVIIYIIIYLIFMYKLHKRADRYNDHFKSKD